MEPSDVERALEENTRRLEELRAAREAIAAAFESLHPKDRVELARWFWDGLRPRRKPAE